MTEGHFISTPEKGCFSLQELLVKTHMRSIKLSLIAEEFLAQLEQFTKTMQQLPDFIDGHQHIHQFPVIRKVILDLYAQKLKNSGAAIRSTWPSITLPQFRFKANVLCITGGKALLKQLIQRGIPHNRYFSGIYDFAPDTNYRELFRQWMSLSQENTLIMCHPGESSNNGDPIAHARIKELDYLSSDNFLEDSQECQIQWSQNQEDYPG